MLHVCGHFNDLRTARDIIYEVFLIIQSTAVSVRTTRFNITKNFPFCPHTALHMFLVIVSNYSPGEY